METCIVCHEPLHKCEKIYAGLGYLCCSKRCAVKLVCSRLDVEQIAEYAIDGCFEELAPDELGIDDEGIVECDWCKNEMDESEVRRTDLGMLCDHCITAIRSRGEEVIEYE